MMGSIDFLCYGELGVTVPNNRRLTDPGLSTGLVCLQRIRGGGDVGYLVRGGVDCCFCDCCDCSSIIMLDKQY